MEPDSGSVWLKSRTWSCFRPCILLPHQQALILPVRLINTCCQIWFGVGIVLGKEMGTSWWWVWWGVMHWASFDTAGARTFNPPPLLGAALPFVIQSIIFDQNCQLHSCHTLSPYVCVCVWERALALKSCSGCRQTSLLLFLAKEAMKMLLLNVVFWSEKMQKRGMRRV